MDKYVPGQRWASEMEPELGLGCLDSISGRRISIFFRAGNCLRQYSLESAPVKRVIFNRGDTIRSRDNIKLTIHTIEEKSGILIYHGNGITLSETELSDTISFTTPKQRLLGGCADPIDLFNLRYETLKILYKHRQSKNYGFAGGRVDLISHQFYIAEEVSSRNFPRVLLSDETGLGKTIEAGLILHRLILSERIGRVLILVPESLVHQWFVELYRRFNLIFTIFNTEFCHNQEYSQRDINPFLEAQMGICSMDWLKFRKRRRNQIIDASWDMLVIDEAHHVEEKKEIYGFVQRLGENVKGMMLLTATPEQPGVKSYFACLKLLDPLRFHNFDLFLEQTEIYKKTALEIDRILKKEKTKDPLMVSVKSSLEIEKLIDRYGPGRIIFRNTRSVVKGFPERIEHLYPLDGSKREITAANMAFLWENQEIFGEIHESINYDFTDDVRINWLVNFLKQDKTRKVLLICSSKEKTVAIDRAVQQKITIKKALFNESLSLIRRDRNAAWFSEKDGARLLICSEIGSEGRNFQFAQHLVMFDLPVNPELIEQRIGRLDRIGQAGKIHIHIPYLKASAEAIIVRWYSSAINIFRHNISGVHFIFKEFQNELLLSALGSTRNKKNNPKDLMGLIERTKKFKNNITKKLKKGRDRLLELNSFKPEKAEPLISAIKDADSKCETDRFILGLFKHFNVGSEGMENRIFHLCFDHVGDSKFPVPPLKKDGMVITFDRKIAVTRGDIDFMTLDHPLVSAAMELLLGTEQGNACFAELTGIGRLDILLESIFILECMAPKELYVDRFMPSTPIRIVMGHHLNDMTDIVDFTDKYPFELFQERLKPMNKSWIKIHSDIISTMIPDLFKKSTESAELKAATIIKKAGTTALQIMKKKVNRLIYLKKTNPDVRKEEIDAARKESHLISDAICSAGLRLDAVRLIRQE